MNFKHAVTSKSIKRGLVTSELNRARNCTTTDDNFGKTVKSLNKKLARNGYPPKLIKSIERALMNSNNSPKRDWASEKENYPERNFTFCSTFTDSECDIIARKIRKTVKMYRPIYNI